MNLVKRTAIRVLRERLRHQTSEVIEAKRTWVSLDIPQLTFAA